jgi:hypothetical protein
LTDWPLFFHIGDSEPSPESGRLRYPSIKHLDKVEFAGSLVATCSLASKVAAGWEESLAPRSMSLERGVFFGDGINRPRG